MIQKSQLNLITKQKKINGFLFFISLITTSLLSTSCYSTGELVPIYQKKKLFKQPVIDVNFTPTIPEFYFSEIPAGKFIMGSPPSEPGRNASGNETQVFVEITKPFKMTITEVTERQWVQIMGYNPRTLIHSNDRETTIDCDKQMLEGIEICPDHPVLNVSWQETQEYIKVLNDTLGLTGCDGTPKSSSGCYRLPTEAEWEYAVRAGTKTAYFFGDDVSELVNYAWFKYVGKYIDQDEFEKALDIAFDNNLDIVIGNKHTLDRNYKHLGLSYDPNYKDGFRKVGLKKPNPWGLYDVYGNVEEWVQDGYLGARYGISFGDKLPGGKDPLAGHKLPFFARMINKKSAHFFEFIRILRGGCFYHSEDYQFRSAWRWMKYSSEIPGSRSIWSFRHVGFRLVRTL